MRRVVGWTVVGIGVASLVLAVASPVLGDRTLAFYPLGAGVTIVAVGFLIARSPTRAASPPADLPPLIVRPMHEPAPGQAPEVRVGMGLGRVWSPEMPLGGYNTTTAIRTPVSWDWERASADTIRLHVDRVIPEKELRHAADHACKAATHALAQRGGVRVHGEGRAERDGELLVLHVEVRSMNVRDADRAPCLAIFRAEFESAIAKQATIRAR